MQSGMALNLVRLTARSKVLISLNLVILLVEPWIDSCCELHIKVEDIDSEGQGEESSDNDHYNF